MNLGTGEMGFITAAIKAEISETKVGDTITEDRHADKVKPLAGFKPSIRWCSARSSGIDSSEFENCVTA